MYDLTLPSAPSRPDADGDGADRRPRLELGRLRPLHRGAPGGAAEFADRRQRLPRQRRRRPGTVSRLRSRASAQQRVSCGRAAGLVQRVKVAQSRISRFPRRPCIATARRQRPALQLSSKERQPPRELVRLPGHDGWIPIADQLTWHAASRAEMNVKEGGYLPLTALGRRRWFRRRPERFVHKPVGVLAGAARRAAGRHAGSRRPRPGFHEPALTISSRNDTVTHGITLRRELCVAGGALFGDSCAFAQPV